MKSLMTTAVMSLFMSLSAYASPAISELLSAAEPSGEDKVYVFYNTGSVNCFKNGGSNCIDSVNHKEQIITVLLQDDSYIKTGVEILKNLKSIQGEELKKDIKVLESMNCTLDSTSYSNLSLGLEVFNSNYRFNFRLISKSNQLYESTPLVDIYYSGFTHDNAGSAKSVTSGLHEKVKNIIQRCKEKEELERILDQKHQCIDDLLN